MYHRRSQYFANLRWLWERIICVLGQLHPHHWVHGTLMTVWMTFSQKVNYIRYSNGIFRDQGLRKSDLHDYQYHNIIITAHLIILFTWIRDLTIMLSLSLSLYLSNSLYPSYTFTTNKCAHTSTPSIQFMISHLYLRIILILYIISDHFVYLEYFFSRSHLF